MANENCLAGMKCPRCGWEESFYIAASAFFVMTDDGTGEEEPDDIEWTDESYCNCRNVDCTFVGKVRDFKK